MTNKNFALRVINDMTLNQLSENDLQKTENKIDIIRNNQSYDGLKNHPKISESLKDMSESVLILSGNKTSSLGNILSHLITLQSLLDIHIEKIRVDYEKEGEMIKSLITNI